MRPSHYTNKQVGVVGCSVCEKPVRGGENALHYLACSQLVCIYRAFRLHVQCTIADNKQKLDIYKLTYCREPATYRLKCCCGADLEPSAAMLRDSLWSGKSEGDRVVEDSSRDKSLDYARAIDEVAFAEEERGRLSTSARIGIGAGIACALSALIHLCALFGPIGPGTTAVLCAVAVGLFGYWLCRYVFCAKTKIPSVYKFASLDAIQKIARTTHIAEIAKVCAKYSMIAAAIFAADIAVELVMLAIVRNLGGGKILLSSASTTENFGESYAPSPRMFALVFAASVIFMCAWPLRRLRRTYIDARAELDLRIVSWALLAWAQCHAIDIMYSAVQRKTTHGRKSAKIKLGKAEAATVDEQFAELEASLTPSAEPISIVVVPAETKPTSKRPQQQQQQQQVPKITKQNRELRKAAQAILSELLMPLLAN